MVKLIAPHIKRSTTIDVPEDRVQHQLDKGWVLAEGETFIPPKPKRPKVIPVDKSLGRKVNEDDGSASVPADTKPQGADVTTKDDGSLVREAGPTGDTKPGLSGKSKEALEAIARAEGVDLTMIADNKPSIKTAIEQHRLGNPVTTEATQVAGDQEPVTATGDTPAAE